MRVLESSVQQAKPVRTQADQQELGWTIVVFISNHFKVFLNFTWISFWTHFILDISHPFFLSLLFSFVLNRCFLISLLTIFLQCYFLVTYLIVSKAVIWIKNNLISVICKGFPSIPSLLLYTVNLIQVISLDILWIKITALCTNW